ncbi:ubiquitin-like protein [Pseudomonas syringae]|uniref:ubiquitin-like protein n=1 Tax=Pseudomonas syringae TaxID=317 RepID=UPI000CD36DA8|nr:ubiquitin [Pseudomonas syringae pv. syringae]
MIIHIERLLGDKFDLDVESSDLISDVKAKIHEKIKDKTSNSIPRQRLIFAGKGLEEDKRSLAYYSIKEDSTLTLVLKPLDGPISP